MIREVIFNLIREKETWVFLFRDLSAGLQSMALFDEISGVRKQNVRCAGVQPDFLVCLYAIPIPYANTVIDCYKNHLDSLIVVGFSLRLP